MKKELQRNVNGMTLGGGSIQHPLSIHSASIGTRWKSGGIQVLMTLVFLFTMGIGQMWGIQNSLVSGKVLPDIPSSTLNLASQTDFSADANGWIVFLTKGVIDSKSWASHGSTDGSTGKSWDAPTGTTAPFVAGSSAGYYTVQTGRAYDSKKETYGDNAKKTHAIRFTGAEKASFLMDYNSDTRRGAVSLFSYDGETQTLVSTQTTTSTSNEILFNSLSTSTTYIAYVYGTDDGNNSTFYEVALKAPAGADVTAPTLSSSNPANSATGVAVSGTIVLTFSEAIASVDDTKFSLSGATIGTVAVDGTDSKKVNVAYSGAANSATVTLSVAADAVADAAGNKSAALDDIAFTTVAAETPVCPSGLSIFGVADYTEGDGIALTTSLDAGNGSITYTWYKGSIAAGNEVGTGDTYSKLNCETSDAGNYYCVASKSACEDAQSSAYPITVAAAPTCPEAGEEVFSMEFTDAKKPSSTINVNGSSNLNLSTYIDITSGCSAKIYNTNSSAQNAVTTTPAVLLKKDTETYIEIVMECPLQQGDIISFTNSKKREICFSANTTRNTSIVTVGFTYTIPAASPLIGKKTFYIFRVESNDTDIKLLKIDRPYVVTLNAGEGATCSATSVSCIAGEKVVLPHAFKNGKRFKGWYDAPTEGIKKDNYFEATANVTLYAQFEDIPANGDLFTLSMATSPAPDEYKLPKATSIDLLKYATITGGAAFFENTDSGNDNKGKITSSGQIDFNDDKALVILNLDFSLVAGDEISFTCPNAYELCFTTTKTRSTTLSSTSKKYTVTDAAEGLKGKSTIYVWRVANETKITSITINRPAVYTATLAPDGGSTSAEGWTLSAGVYTKSILSTAAQTLPTMTREGYKFDKWTANQIVTIGETPVAVEGDIAAGASVKLSANTTFTAHWNQTFAVTYVKGDEGADGTMTDSNSPYVEGAEVTLLTNTFSAPSGYAWSAWAVTETVSGNPVAVSEGKFTMPGVAVTVTAQWQLISDFDVKFFQGYGDPDVQIGETQSISTGGHAVAPADPERAGFAFLGWSTDGTEANIKDVATYGITTATNFTAMWKQVFVVTFDGGNSTNVLSGAKVASPNSPTQAGKVFQGWYNGEDKYDFNAAVTGNLALTSKWVDANANHYTYAYNDDFHFDGVVYKTPDGKTKDPGAAEASNVALATNPYTLFSGTAGITSIIATNGIYDYKKAAGTKHITAYLKLKADDATTNVVFTIASGYTAVLKLKMNGYSSNATISLKKGENAVTPSGTQEGTAEGKDYGELTYNLTAGAYTLTTASKTLYISHIDLEAAALPAHSVTYKPGYGGSELWVVDPDATEVRDGSTMFTAPTTGQVFNGWKDALNNDVEVGAIVSADMTLTAQWINVYAVTFNMNDHGAAIDQQDIKEGAKAAKPADPVADGFDFGGWFTDNGTFEAPFDFNTPITAATPLYAKWTADPCPAPFSLSKVVLTSATDGTVTGYNGNEYAGEKVIGGLKDDDNTAEVDPSHEGVEEGYKLNGGGSGIVFATLKKGNFQEGDRVIVTITAKQNSYKIEEVSQDVLHIYYGTNASDATKLTTLESVSTAGSYTYRLKAADITAIGTKKGIGVFRESSNGQNPYVYSVEIKGCRSFAVMHTLTFKNIDGTATIAAEPLEEGAYASTVAPTAPKIAMKRFKGWSESIGSSTVDLTTYTITEDKTLYAVYEDIVCPTSGTVYKFEIKDELPSENLPTSTDKDMSSYITATGDGYLTYTATANNKATINSDGTIQMKDASAAYLKVELECALAAGDQIRAHVTNNPMRVQVGTTYDSDKDLILAKNAYEFVAITSAMEGKQVLYIIRSSNGNANLADFEIYRPAKYTVSFDMKGHGIAPADIENVLDGSKIAAPSPAPTDEDYSFAGWYKETTLENAWDFANDVVNANTTLYAKWLDKSDATLKSLKYGETEIIEVGTYTYNIDLPSKTASVPALTAETSNPSATKVVTDADAFDVDGHATSTVVVTPEKEGAATQTYTVNFTKLPSMPLLDVTASTTWTFANAATYNSDFTDEVLANFPGMPDASVFDAQRLQASGAKIKDGYLQGTPVKFHTTTPGKVRVEFSNTGGGTRPNRNLLINGNPTGDFSAGTAHETSDWIVVPAGDVVISGLNDDPTQSDNLNFYKIEFDATPNLTRDVTPGLYGTICYPTAGYFVGGTIYEIAYYDATEEKIFFDEIVNGQMIADRPYVFLPYEGVSTIGMVYSEAEQDEETAGKFNGLNGTYVDLNSSNTTESPLWENYLISNNQYIRVTGSNCTLRKNRAYIVMSEMTTTPSEPRHGRRRIAIGAAPRTATGFDNLVGGETPQKIMIDGTIYILRGEKLYDATGRLVK